MVEDEVLINEQRSRDYPIDFELRIYKKFQKKKALVEIFCFDMLKFILQYLNPLQNEERPFHYNITGKNTGLVLKLKIEGKLTPLYHYQLIKWSQEPQ